MAESEKLTFYIAGEPVYLSGDNRLVPIGERFGVPAGTPAGDGWVAADGPVPAAKKG